MKSRSDPNGHFIICDIKTVKNITLCNLYAPNDDKHDFVSDISTYQRDFECDEIIIIGDFNLVISAVAGVKFFGVGHIMSVEGASFLRGLRGHARLGGFLKYRVSEIAYSALQEWLPAIFN